ncbi:MAG: lipoprotein [Porticoccaceae bacterium]|jgi:predicted small lipoprotein YifL
MPASNSDSALARHRHPQQLLWAALFGALLAITGCGNKGPLYLPSAPEAHDTAPEDGAAEQAGQQPAPAANSQAR